MAGENLTGYDRWMFDQNVEYARDEGFDVVVARLRAGGYNRVADAVEEAGKPKSFTYCSDEAVAAVIDRLPDHYNLNLNRSDMTELVTALQYMWEHTGNTGDWAGDFLSGIASTLGIEFV